MINVMILFPVKGLNVRKDGWACGVMINRIDISSVCMIIDNCMKFNGIGKHKNGIRPMFADYGLRMADN
jgi:hypothetical protein